MNLDDNTIIQDIKIQDQPTGYNYDAPLPNGFTTIRTGLYWGQPEPTLLGDGSSRPRSRRVAIIDDDRPLPFRLSAAACPPPFPKFRHLAHLRQNDRRHYQQMP
eukprot:2164582-Pyramimonas_sp.AAC.1